jgi:hypothetical protein
MNFKHFPISILIVFLGNAVRRQNEKGHCELSHCFLTYTNQY